MVKDAIAANQNAIGLQLSLLEENNYRSLIFASSDHADSTKRPKLVLCYNLPNQINELTGIGNDIKVFPNPVLSGKFKVDFNRNNSNDFTYQLLSMDGRVCKEGDFKMSDELNVFDLNCGIYQLLLIDAQQVKRNIPIYINH
jgi:hypothetical protein